MKSRVRWAFLAVTALALLAFAAAPASADLEARAKLGFGGRWVMDAATPLSVTLKNTGTAPLVVDMTVSQSDALTSADVVNRRVVHVPAGASRDELFLVPGPKQWNGNVQVRLDVDPGVPIHSLNESGDRGTLTFAVEGSGAFTSDQIAYASGVLGVVGDPSGRVAARVREADLSAGGTPERSPSKRIEVLGISAESLRLAPIGLDGVDTLLVCDPDAAFGDDPATAQGLIDWVSLGGTLVVSLGEHAGAFAASPLAREMPATWTGAERVAYGKLLSDFTALTDAVTDVVGPCATLRPKKDATALGSLRVDRRLGMGRITLLAYCLRDTMSLPGINKWDVTTLLAPVIAVPPVPKPGQPLNDWQARRDFTSTIGNVLQQGAFEPPPLALVVLGIILYVVVVGPLDWFVLKRLRKERLTTITFLGAVTGFTVLAYGASILLFSTGARVNRVVIADLADAGAEGRQVLRFMDIAGYYSPTGSDRKLTFGAAAAVMPPGLPGSSLGGFGSPLPLQVVSADPLHPDVMVQLAFRSQRVVRAVCVGTIGPTIDVEWQGAGDTRGVRVVNGLPVDLDDVAVYVGTNGAYSLGDVRSGATSKNGAFERSVDARDTKYQADDSPYRGRFSRSGPLGRLGVRRMLETMTTGSWSKGATSDSTDHSEVLAGLRKSGISRAGAFDGKHALVVAHASKFPVPLPGDDGDGDVYVVLRKEVSLP